MDRRIFLTLGAAVAALAAGAGFLLGARAPDNLTLAALSGEALQDDGLLLVDIRRPEEWQQTGVIEGARLVTYTDPESFLAQVRPHLEEGQSLALICRTGNRTSRATRQIASLVDAPVIDVAGGMVRVLGEGYAAVAPSREMGCTVC